jgi:DnaJ-domain-containing protein 1
MDSVSAVLVIGVGLAVTLLVGIASQRRSRMAAQAAQRTPPPPPPARPLPTQEQEEDLEAVSRAIEQAREELRWLHEQVARERARLERLRRQTPAQNRPVQAPPAPAPAPDSPWVILGLKPGASAEDMRRRYRLLSRVWHPDRFMDAPPELRAEAELMMGRLNRAYQTLTGQPAGARRG